MDIEQTIQQIMDEKHISREEIKQMIDEQIKELSGLIDEEGAIVIVAKNLGLDLQNNQQAANMEQDQPIGKLAARMNASVIGRIINIENVRRFNKKDGSEGVLLPFVMQDTSGMIKVLAWGGHHAKIAQSPQFAINEIVRVVNGFVKPSQTGQLELHVGDRSALLLQPDQIDRSLIPEIKTKENLTFTKISDLSLTQPFYNIEGSIGTVFQPKSFSRKDGSEGKRASVNIIDDTGSVYITFWGDHCQKMEKLQTGQVVGITNLSPKKNYMDPAKIDLTATSTTTTIIKEKSPIPSPNNIDSSTITINSIKSVLDKGGFGNFEGQIQNIEDQRTVTLRDGTQKNLLKFVLADESAAIRITLWGDQIPEDIGPGQTLRMTGVMVKLNSFSKQMEGNLTRMGTLEKITKEISTTHTLKPIQSTGTMKFEDRNTIPEIQSEGFFTFKGTIIREINRITTYRACSNCNRKIDNCQCAQPGNPVNRMILNVLIDDGKDSIRGTLMGDTAEEFLGEKTDHIAQLNDSGEIEVFLQEKNRDLLGTDYIFRGKARFSDYSDAYEVNINRFQLLDPTQEARELIDLVQNS